LFRLKKKKKLVYPAVYIWRSWVYYDCVYYR